MNGVRSVTQTLSTCGVERVSQFVFLGDATATGKPVREDVSILTKTRSLLHVLDGLVDDFLNDAGHKHLRVDSGNGKHLAGK